MKITKLDCVVGIIAGLICFGVLINVPVWAMFIGWGWYTALGSDVSIFRSAIPSMFVGYILSAISIVTYTASNNNIYVLVFVVGLTVFIQMLSLKKKAFSCALASFNAYSCLFAVYSAGTFPAMTTSMQWDINNVLIALLWVGMANTLGLICGYISINLGTNDSDEKRHNKQDTYEIF